MNIIKAIKVWLAQGTVPADHPMAIQAAKEQARVDAIVDAVCAENRRKVAAKAVPPIASTPKRRVIQSIRKID